MHKTRVFLSRVYGSQQGFSMVEVMVSFALLALAGIGAMQMSSMVMGSAHDNAIPPMQFTNVEQQIYQMISVETTCRLALGGPTAPPPLGIIATGAPVQTLTVGPSAINLYQPVALGAGARPVYATATPGTKFGVWTVSSLTLQLAPGAVLSTTLPNQVIMTLQMQHTLANATVMTSTATFNFSALVDGASNIISCFPLTLGSDVMDGQAEPMCGPYQALRSYGARLICRGVRCPVGHTAAGFDPVSGEIICL